MMTKSLSIIIPAWNEQKTIAKTLTKYLNYFANEYQLEIIVVMDGCTDHTYDIVKSFSIKNPQIKPITFTKKLGKGGGIIKGFEVARGDIISFTDADGSTSPEELHQMIENMDDADVVIGSRWLDDSIIITKESLPRRIASRSFNLLIRILFNLPFKDTQCGAKIFKRYVIVNIINDLELTNFAFDVDLIYQINKNGYIIHEVPITWSHDSFSELAVAKAVPSMLLSIVGLRVKNTPYWNLIPKWISKPIFNRVKNI